MAIQNPNTGNASEGAVLNGRIPTYNYAGLPAPSGKVQIARLLDRNKGVVVSNSTNWSPIEGQEDFKPEDFGIVGDGVTDCLAGFLAAQAAMPDTVNFVGGQLLLSPGVYRISAPLHWYRPGILAGIGGGITGLPPTIISLDPGAGLIIDNDVSGPFTPLHGQGAQGVKIRDLYFQGSAPKNLPWQALTHYNVGDVTINVQWYGGFTQFINVCTVAGTSGASEPTWPARGDINTYVHEGAITSGDGGVTWKSVSCPGIWMKTISTIEHCYFTQCYGDGIYGYGWGGQSPATAISGAKIIDCAGQGNLGRGTFIAGSDANSVQIEFFSQDNKSGGIADFSSLGNLYSHCLAETNGLFVWDPNIPNGDYAPVGATLPHVVPSINAMDAMQTATGGSVYYYELQSGSGNTGVTEPVWPTTLGQTVADNGLVWVCKGVYSYGQAYMCRLNSTNGSVFVECYQENDQRLNEMTSGTIWLGGNGGFFRKSLSSSVLRLQGQGNGAYQFVDKTGTTPQVSAALGDVSGSLPMAFRFDTLSSGSPINGYRMTADSDGKHWSLFSLGGVQAMQLSTATASEGEGIVSFPSLIIIDGQKLTWSAGSPPAGGTRGDIVFNSLFGGSGVTVTNAPMGWACTTTDPSAATWSPFYSGRAPMLPQASSNHTMTAADSGSIYNNAGSGARVDITACGDHVGVTGAIQVSDSHGMRLIAPGGGYQINYGGLFCAANGYFESTEVGATLAFISDESSHGLKVTSLTGIWNIDGVPIRPELVPGVETLLSSTSVDMSISTKQSVYTVPAGVSLVVTKTVIRSLSATNTTASGGIGFDAGGSNVIGGLSIPSTTSEYSISAAPSSAAIGAAAAVLGIKMSATQAALTAVIDVFGYTF